MNRQKERKWICFVIVVVLCIVAVVATFSIQPLKEASSKRDDIHMTGIPVTVRTVKPGKYSAVVTALGEVVPRWQVTLKSQVDGRIIYISDQLETGKSVKKGDVLIKIEQSAFQQQVAEANNRLAAAKVNMLQEEREAWEARKNWKLSGINGAPTSQLVLREPQMASARSEVEAAKASLIYANAMLGYTEIRAPFDAVIIKQGVNPGETLFAGDEVAVLYGVETAEVSVNLDSKKWELLADSIIGTKVKLYDIGQDASWHAEVVRSSQHLDRESRLRKLFMQIKRPVAQTPPLFPGTFVRAEMTGRIISDLLRIPESALTKQGLVWFVDHKNLLSAFQVEPVFHGRGVVFIKTPEKAINPMRVAVSPNSSFANGLVVKPKSEERGLQ